MPTMIAPERVISHWPASRLAAAMVGYGNVPSLVTLPTWLWVLGWVV